MKRLFTENVGWKLLALGLSFALWVVLGHDQETAASVSAQVRYRDLADGLEISSGIPETVTLELRGPSRRLQHENLAAVAVFLDFSHVPGPGERTFDITAGNTNLPLGVSFSRAIPAQVRLRFERLVAREIPIEARYTGALPPGYRLERTEFQPPNLSVRGPESHVALVTSVQTDPIDLTGIVGQRGGQVHVFIGDPQVEPQGSGRVNYKMTVQKTISKEIKQ
jgi:hypothetical protein